MSDYRNPHYDDRPGSGGPDYRPPRPGGKVPDTDPNEGYPVPPSVAPTGTLTGGASPAAANGPQTGGMGGFGFTNLSSYLYANPMGSGPGSGVAPTPTGASGAYNPEIHGYSPTADYTAGMAGVDNALNGAYGRVPYTATPGSGGSPAGGPAPSGGPDMPPGDPNAGAGPDPRNRGSQTPLRYQGMRTLLMGSY